MLTKLVVRNFKQFEEAEIPLGSGCAFVGPNNSGKTSALQALSLWHAGLQKLIEKHGGIHIATKRPAAVINRKDLVYIPTSESFDLWRNKKRSLMEITVHADDGCGGAWRCGLEFDYGNPETFYCRPLRTDLAGNVRMAVPQAAAAVRVRLIPPMSGLAETEALIQPGRINVLLGHGKTADVLRNICYSLAESRDQSGWEALCDKMQKLFGVLPQKPISHIQTGDLELAYVQNGVRFDIGCAGRGMHQMLLLLAFLYYEPPGTVFLLDEPDAHLEILRQEQFYRLMRDTTESVGSQLLVASHSEKILNEAAVNEKAVFFAAGQVRLIGANQAWDVKKSLDSYGWEQYVQAVRRRWVLYLEGGTDKNILSAFAERLSHPAADVFRGACFVRTIGSDAMKREYGHFSALRLAVPELRGLAITDRRQMRQAPPDGLTSLYWRRNEIENYVFSEEVLLAYASGFDRYSDESLKFGTRYADAMREAIENMQVALETTGDHALFSYEARASKQMERLLDNFAKAVNLAPLPKAEFYRLVAFVPDGEVDAEVVEKLDEIVAVAEAVGGGA